MQTVADISEKNFLKLEAMLKVHSSKIWCHIDR